MRKIIKTRKIYIIITVCLIVLFSNSCSNKTNQIPQSPKESTSEITQPVDNPKENPAKPEESTSNNTTLPTGLIPSEMRILAKDFTLEKIGGGTLSLSSYKGNIVLLDFTTTWCYWCEVQAPHVEELYKNYSNKNFTVISIDCKEEPQIVKSKYPSGKHIFPVVLDKDGSVSYSYGINGYPTFLLVDKDGKIAYFQEGYKENMKEVVSKIIDYLLENE
jgi:cytochrome c-type biogenesis protein